MGLFPLTFSTPSNLLGYHPEAVPISQYKHVSRDQSGGISSGLPVIRPHGRDAVTELSTFHSRTSEANQILESVGLPASC